MANKRIEMWFKEAWSQLGFFILQCLAIWAREGNVEYMKTNIYYFKIDLCVFMCNLMKDDGIQKSCCNVSFIFDHYIEKKMDEICKHYLLNAIRKKNENKKNE